MQGKKKKKKLLTDCNIDDKIPYSLFQAKDWQKALELYEHLKSIKSKQTVSTVNALITALCKSQVQLLLFFFYSFLVKVLLHS